MRKTYRITVFGDSIPYEYSIGLEDYLNMHNNNYAYSVNNRGVPGEFSTQVKDRLLSSSLSGTDCVLIHVGMNDWRKGVDMAGFEKNMEAMLKHTLGKKIRTLVCSITPDFNGASFALSQNYEGTSKVIVEYNEVLKALCRRYHVRFVDAYALWIECLNPLSKGLKDAIHPNELGRQVIYEALSYFIPRENLTVVWPFNGKYAQCNYQCPYCYVPTSVNVDRMADRSMVEWEQAFIDSFGVHQHITFYLSYGEPFMAPQFMDLLKMVGEHENWEVMITSNLSTDLNRIKDFKIVRDGRLNINCSFHPTEVSIDKFICQLDKLRTMGIESPVVYVMWPGENLEKFDEYFEIFRKNKYLVHVRRFRGMYKGKKYPESYTEPEKLKFMKYMDKGTISYMLSNESSLGKLTYLGMHHVLVDTDGTIEICDEYPGDRDLGNVFDATARLYDLPQPFPGPVSLGAVDDVANLLEIGYDELRGNHVMSFARQGGVYRDELGEPVYSYENFDFTDTEKVRKEFFTHERRTKPFKSRLKWFLKHRFLYYTIERNYLRGRQFLKGKLWLLRNKKGSLKELFSLHG